MVIMMKYLLILALVCVAPAWCYDWDVETPLDLYIRKEDPGLPSWEKIDSYTMDRCNVVVLNFTSQIWKDETWSTQPIWWHWLLIFMPLDEMVYKDAGMMFIEGGGNSGGPPGEDNDFVRVMCLAANQSGASSALLRMIPNQPIRYMDDPSGRNRTEDANIAWTWKTLIDDPDDPELLLQFPMTKAAVKALDVYNEALKAEDPESDIQKFTVAGGSKRGWITWLLGATDKRVQFMCPIVLSCLDLVDNLHKHWMSLGGWTFVFNDYYEVNITAKLDHPNTHLMADKIDPLMFKERFTMPKVIMSATGDEFFLPDDSHMFYDQLPEPKWMMMMHNSNHGMINAYRKLFGTMTSFFILLQEENGLDLLPKLNWTRSWDPETGVGEIILTTDRTPELVTAFWADTPHEKRRDFRMVTADGLSGVAWRRWWRGNGTLEITDENTFRYTEEESLSAPYRGMVVNTQFPGPGPNLTIELTSEMNIIPDTYPFEDCYMESCYGELV